MVKDVDMRPDPFTMQCSEDILVPSFSFLGDQLLNASIDLAR